jgi:hypothetical protein
MSHNTKIKLLLRENLNSIILRTMRIILPNFRFIFLLLFLVQSHFATSQSFCTEYFNMQNSVLVSGTDRQQGAIYKFPSAAPNIDVYIKVESLNNAWIAVFDRADLGFDYAWQPHIPTNSAAGGYVDWLIYFKVAGTNRDTVACPAFTAIDIDGGGAGSGVQEYVEARDYSSYDTLTPTSLTLSAGTNGYTLKATGPETVYNGISTTDKNVMIQFNYINVTSFKYRTGVNGKVDESGGRYFSLHFNSYLTCNNYTSGGIIGSNETNCAGFQPQLIKDISSPSGGAGSSEYQWLQNTVSANPTNSNWKVIPNSNSLSFTPPPVSVTTHYMRQSRRNNCSQFVASNVVSKIIAPSPTINISSNVAKICPYGEVTFTATVSPSGSYSYQWQKSTDGGATWADVTGANTAVRKISVVGLADYRVVVKTATCTFYSGPLSISTFDTTPPVFTTTPSDIVVACNAVPPAVILTATDDCYVQDIIFHETYSSCANPALNTNGGLENVGNLPMDTTFYGYPARKLPNYDKSINGWEAGFPPADTESGLLVNDNNNTINNPEGNDFLWVPGNGFCLLNAPINLKAGQCIEISLWAAALSKLNPQTATRIQVEVFNLKDDSVVVPFSQVLPAGVSINNMNWQKIVTRFAVPADGQYRFAVTQSFEPAWGASARGMAVDGFFIRECCTAPPMDCKNYTITRNWTARDVTGNATKHTQVITVKDTQAPIFNNVPANITICGTTVPAAAILTATDNCDATPKVTLSAEVSTKTTNGSCTDNFYTVTRRWKAVDNCGNEVAATQVITVIGTITPTIAAVSNCSTRTTILSANIGSCIPNANYQWQKWDGTNWVNVGSNQNTFDTPVLTANQDYRVVVSVPNSTCSGTSSTVTANPVLPLEVTIGTTNATVCLNSIAAIAASAKGGVGVLTYQWQSSTDNVNWANIAGANSAIYVIPTSTVSNKFYRVIVSANESTCNPAISLGIPVKVESSAGCECVLQACDAYTKLVYKNPVQINDATGLVGDKWRFSNVAAGFDAIVEITKASNANSLNAIDNTAVNVDDWCPEINFDFLAGQDSYVDWKISIVAAGTNTPANLPTSSRVTSYDVDGNANYREMHGHINANGFIVNNPTELVMANESPFTLVLGSTNEYTSISTDSKVKATFYYPGQNNVFQIRLGVRTTVASGSFYRQFAVSFDPCISYTSPDINPQKPEIVGTTATCVGGANATYSTTQPFNTYNWTVVGGTIVSGQGTRNMVVDWTSTGAKTVNLSTVDANGCVGTTSFAVAVNTDPKATLQDANSTLRCEGETTTLNAAVSGGVGTPSYQWQSSLDGIVWENIIGATNVNYDIADNKLGMKYYRLVVTFGGSECNQVTSTSKQVESVSALDITATLEGFTECLGGTKKLSIKAQGGKNTTYQWQSSVDNVNWVDIVGEIDTVYTPPSTVAGTKYYRVTVKSASAGCGTIQSDPATVIIVPDPAVNVSVSVSSICTGGTAVLTANIADPSGTCGVQWQSNSNGTTWNDILNETKPSLTVGALNSTTRYRIILNCSGSGCCN